MAELPGRWPATPALLRWFEWLFEMGSKQLVELGVPTLEAPRASGRAVFGWWLEAAGAVDRTYVSVGSRAPGFMRAENLLTMDGRLDVRRIDSAGERLGGGHLRVMGLVRGFALLKDGATPRQVEVGVRDLINSWMSGASWWGELDDSQLN